MYRFKWRIPYPSPIRATTATTTVPRTNTRIVPVLVKAVDRASVVEAIDHILFLVAYATICIVNCLLSAKVISYRRTDHRIK